jgi:methionyl-tRNA formyltransferase
MTDRIDYDWLDDNEFDYIVSYRYRHIVPQRIVELYRNRIINLHISFLPWNKGADPNLWSFLEDTPKGVTIHYMDSGVDTGDILVQKEVFFDNNTETLKTTYESLNKEIVALFYTFWPLFVLGEVRSHVQPVGGSYHYAKDKEQYRRLLCCDWDTPVKGLVGVALGRNDENR